MNQPKPLRIIKPVTPGSSIAPDAAKKNPNGFRRILLFSLILHVIAAIFIIPHLRTQMKFDEEAEKDRAQLVQEREEQRREELRQWRKKIEMPKDHAQELVKRENEKRRDPLVENLLKLRQAREKALAEREKALEEIAKREKIEVLPDQIERVKEAMRRMVNAAHQVERSGKFENKPTELKKEVEAKLKELDELQKKLVEDPEHAPDPSALANEIKKMAEEHAEQYKQWQLESTGATEHRSMEAKNHSQDLAKAAAPLAEGLDMQELNAAPELQTAQHPLQDAPASELNNAPPADLYEAAVALEKEIVEADQQTRAAELAEAQGTSIAESLKKMETPDTGRPDLSEPLSHAAKTDGKEGTSSDPSGESSASDASGSDGPKTVGDVTEFKEAIAKAVSETTDMARKAARITGDVTRPASSRSATSESQRAMETLSRSTRGTEGRVVDMTSLQLGNFSGGTGEGGMDGLTADQTGRGGEMIGGKDNRTIRLNTREVVANSLPGRQLTESSSRMGYLYLDTWYMIGPWDNWSRADFEIVHPPEQRIDLDAVYTDGKNGPKNPLRWYFVQSDRIAIQPRNPTYSATYYAYTEVFSDQTREMLVAVASDDMAKVWLNGQVIWTDVGQSSWNLDEGFRKVIFKKGFNTVLVRLENGPAYTAFSVLLCPPGLGKETAHLTDKQSTY
ncbi:MAG: hypothetical protein ACFCUX_04775 [Candidatus Methylacidiphilales bacterium]